MTLLSGGIAFTVTKLFNPLYESFSVVFPSSNFSRDKTLENFDYGFDIHAERLIQLMQSRILMDSIVDEFDLIHHYRLDTNDNQYSDDLLRIYYKRVVFVKTRYKAVTVIVRDEDPEIAARIANEVARLVNVVNNELIHRSLESAIQSLESDVHRKSQRISMLRDSVTSRISSGKNLKSDLLSEQIILAQANISILLDSLDRIRRRLNVFDLGFQINILNEKLAEAQSIYQDAQGSVPLLEKSLPPGDTLLLRKTALLSGSKNQVTFFSEELRKLNSGNREFNSISDRIEQENTLLENLKRELSLNSTPSEGMFESFEMIEPRKILDYEMHNYLSLQEKLELAKSGFQNPLPAAHLVSPARPSTKKVFPQTLLIVVVSSLAGAFFTLFLLLFRDSLMARLVPNQG